MPPTELAKWLALLLVLAFFLGLAFEEVCKRDEPTIPGGIRTFPLVGLAGAMLYLSLRSPRAGAVPFRCRTTAFGLVEALQAPTEARAKRLPARTEVTGSTV